jgi:ribosomal-protein-alanine N-acetyltransferase
MSDMALKTRKDARHWIRWVNREKFDVNVPCVVLAVTRKSDKKCIGLIGVAPKRELGNEIEILFSLADEYQNQGYITEAGRALIDWAFKYTQMPYLAAIVKRDNPASSRVIEKLGFAHAGERRIEYDGAMTDFHYYRLERPGA